MKLEIVDIARVCHEAERAVHLAGGVEDVPFCSISPEARDAYINKIEACIDDPELLSATLTLPDVMFSSIVMTLAPFLKDAPGVQKKGQTELTGKIDDTGRHEGKEKNEVKEPVKTDKITDPAVKTIHSPGAKEKDHAHK